jgi:peptidoglycan/LPS O-acetylase OafA/YrhL
LWSFGLIGAFLRHLPQRNAVLGYLSESSYWVYLVHMLGTIGFGALVLTWPLAAGWKMLANIALTTAFALASYQLLVRHTWVGRLLNGPRADTASRPSLHSQEARA